MLTKVALVNAERNNKHFKCSCRFRNHARSFQAPPYFHPPQSEFYDFYFENRVISVLLITSEVRMWGYGNTCYIIDCLLW
jgi:hypothetical protein